MIRFAERSGLIPGCEQVRYLWTDAFAVCNFLELGRASGESRYTELALRLVDQVHRVLGKHQSDDSRTGWISGLDDTRAKLHPTRGGLRIGKPLNERGPHEPMDERLEWERDGQYFHYLSKWMHALDQVSRATQDPRYNVWSQELAQTAYGAFTRAGPAGQPPRMAWKLSIDLSRVLVPSMGQHDPLDGLVTCVELQWTASRLASRQTAAASLSEATRGFAAMTASGSWITADPLGLGGLLMDACRVAQLMPQQIFGGDALLRTLLTAARTGLAHYVSAGELQQPASRRLAFRELGLSIGLHAIQIVAARVRSRPEAFDDPGAIHDLLSQLQAYASLESTIESFWLLPAHKTVSTWTSHLDINEVMLATQLMPDGFLRL